MRPILIAGPTASGKSALALALAERLDGTIVNADALQVYDGWRVLTARPDPAEEARAPHRLYGHVAMDADYSTGQWLREVRPLLRAVRHPIIVGGTGLNFAALTDGLAEIPPTPQEVRAEGDARGPDAMRAELAQRDPATLARIDAANPMRVQRAWEVLRATGRGLADWQADTPPPDLPIEAALPLVLRSETGWLDGRIARRFDAMLAGGALEEVRRVLPDWTPTRPSSRAIGAPELVAHLRGEIDLDEVRARAALASRRYAKRQRTWFRNRMKDWRWIDLDDRTDLDRLADRLAADASGGDI